MRKNFFSRLGLLISWTSLALSALWATSLPSLARTTLSEGNEAIYIYSDDGKNVFLGCFNCSSRNSNSIFNYASPYSSAVKTNSIFNYRKVYGSPTSQYSATNPEASNPPLLIGQESKKIYGKLSLGSQGYQSSTAKIIYSIFNHQLHSLQVQQQNSAQ